MKTFALSLAATASLLPAVFGVPVANEGALYARNNGGQRYVKDPKPNTTAAPYPTYKALSDFDFESFNLGLHQEWIELDLFHYGIAAFSAEEWQKELNIGPEYLSLLRFMANQEEGHAQMITNILGADIAPKQCTYNYTGAFTDPRSYVDFSQRLTRWGESGVYGFLTHLNSRDSAQLLTQSISTEARQQMVFRQFTGAFPMPVHFESGIPQAWAWTLLAPWIQSCPKENPKVGWSNFPALTIKDEPKLQFDGAEAAVSTNRSALTHPSERIDFTWEEPGKQVGPDLAYTTSKNGDKAAYALFVSQLNATYTPLHDISGNSAHTFLPYEQFVYNTSISTGNPALNGTGFVALTSKDVPVTPANLTAALDYMVAGPAIMQYS